MAFNFMIPTIIGYSFGMFCLISSETFKVRISLVGGRNFIFSLIYILIYSLVTLIPNVAILSRRFHDRSMTMTLPIIFMFSLSLYQVLIIYQI